MLNVLYEQFPKSVRVCGMSYPIATDFREWIRFSELIDDESVPWEVKCRLMLQWYQKQIPDDLEAAVYALGDFLSARKLYSATEENDSNEKGIDKPVFSFSEDAGCIYSAFIDSYGIDLQTVVYMHWWKFRILFDGLPEDTEIKQRMMYRGIDPKTIKDKAERKRVQKIQRQIALRKRTRKVNDYDIGDMFA